MTGRERFVRIGFGVVFLGFGVFWLLHGETVLGALEIGVALAYIFLRVFRGRGRLA